MITAIMPKPSKFTVPTIEYLREYGKTKTWELFVRDEAPRYGVDTAWGTGQLTDYFETELEAYMTAYKRDIDPLFHLNAQFRKDAEEFYSRVKVSYKPKPSNMDTKGDSGCEDEHRVTGRLSQMHGAIPPPFVEELTCHRINRGCNEIVAEYEDAVKQIETNEQFGDFIKVVKNCVVPKDELELLRATRWYCCSDISDELMVQMYRRRSD